MRNDKLVLRTDEEEFLYAGWDYGAPYSLDPLNGVSVDLKTAQSVNQIGSTVEQQSVAGVYRELIIDFWGPNGEAQAKKFLNALPYFTKWTMYLGDKWFCRFVLSKTPYTKSIHPYPVLAFMLFCPKPFWYNLQAQSFCINGFVPSFRLPINYSTPHRFGVRTSIGWLNAYNPGALSVPFTATLKSDGAVVNPCVLNILTSQSIRILTTLTPGQVIEIYRTTTDKLAVKRTEDGTEENIFSLLDEDSDLLELAPGDNLLKATADSGETSLQVTVRFYPMVSGILPEVIS